MLYITKEQEQIHGEGHDSFLKHESFPKIANFWYENTCKKLKLMWLKTLTKAGSVPVYKKNLD